MTECVEAFDAADAERNAVDYKYQAAREHLSQAKIGIIEDSSTPAFTFMRMSAFAAGYRAAEADAPGRVKELEIEIAALRAFSPHGVELKREHMRELADAMGFNGNFYVSQERLDTVNTKLNAIVESNTQQPTPPRALAVSDEQLKKLGDAYYSCYDERGSYSRMRALIATWPDAPEWPDMRAGPFRAPNHESRHYDWRDSREERGSIAVQRG